MTLDDLNKKYDRLQKKYGEVKLNSIYNGGCSNNPDYCFVFMNPTSRNIASDPSWNGPRSPWLGTKNIWDLFYAVNLFDEELYKKIKSKKKDDWSEEFCREVYAYITSKNYYITNLAKCTQLDARVLSDKVFKDYLKLFEQEIEIVNPKTIILFGNQVSSIFLNEKVSVSTSRKKCFKKIINNKEYNCYVVYYPVGNGRFNIDKSIEDIKWIIKNNGSNLLEVGKFAGFCGGVTNSYKKTEQVLEESKNTKIYCLGELVHNGRVVSDLVDKGLTIINDLGEVEDNSKVIIRAHGISKRVYEEANKRGITLIDLTCPKVLDIHKKVSEYASLSYFIILVGSKSHPEVIGTISFCGNNSIVIENMEDLESLQDNYKDIVIFAQTTYKESLFLDIVDKIKEKYSNSNIVVENTICNATHLRQEECMKMSRNKDCMIIIGGVNSSNTKKLYEIAKSNCSNTCLIENYKELDLDWLSKFKNIGLMAGASTPKISIDEVIKAIEKGIN